MGFLTGRYTLKRLEYGVGQGDWKSTEWVKDDVIVTFSLKLVPADLNDRSRPSRRQDGRIFSFDVHRS